jgi:hypothetical protein
MKKKQYKSELVEWSDLKIGDMVESSDTYLFCYSDASDMVLGSCLGRAKTKKEKYSIVIPSGTYKRLHNPSKAFIKTCKRLLNYNLKNGYVNNLDYIEALASLKKHDKTI